MVATPVQNQTISVTYGTDGAKIASGRTEPGATDWKTGGNVGTSGIYVYVDTSAAGFTTVPIYTLSVGGNTHHWGIAGSSSIYNPTAKGFEVEIRWEKGYHQDGNALTPALANEYKWHINWIAIEPAQGTSTQPSSTTTRPNQLPNLGCQNEKQLRSASGTTPATEIKFINQTASLVKVYWVKADGQRQFFRDLKPGESFTQSTYVDHVWVVTDEKGGCLGIYKGEKDPKDAIIEGNNTALPTPGKYYYLIAKHSNKALAVDGGGTANGTNVLQWDNTKNDHFKWLLEDAGDGSYYLTAKHSGKALAVTGASTADGGNVLQWDNTKNDHFRWKLEDAGNGYFYLIAKHSGKALQVNGGNKQNGGNVDQWTKQDVDHHKWKFEAV
jgi:hypothetical protein